MVRAGARLLAYVDAVRHCLPSTVGTSCSSHVLRLGWLAFEGE